MTLVIRRYAALPIQPPATNPVVIASVNGGANPYSNQTSVLVVGSGFGTQQGTATLNGINLVVTGWTSTLLDIAWPDIPFNPSFSDIDMDTTLEMLVTNTDLQSSSVDVTTGVNPNAYYGVITGIPPDSIYANDTGITTGVDKGYIRVLSGTVDTVNVATGVLSGISPGAQIEYAVYDVSIPEWAN